MGASQAALKYRLSPYFSYQSLHILGAVMLLNALVAMFPDGSEVQDRRNHNIV